MKDATAKATGAKPVGDEATANGEAQQSAEVLKVMCHMLLSRWADRHDIAIDPVELATLFMDLGAEDAKRIDRAVDSFARAAGRKTRKVSWPPAASAKSPTPQLDPDTASPQAEVSSDTARLILQAATKVFLEQGYDISLDQIAKYAGVTKPTIYSYFKGKKELFRAAMIGVAEDMAPRIDPPDPGQDLRAELLRYARAFRAIILSERNLLAYRAALIHLQQEPDLGRLMGQKSLLKNREGLVRFFNKAMDVGLIRRLDPELLSEHFFAATAGQARTKLLMGLDLDPPGREEEYLAQLVDIFLLGVATPAA